MLLENSVILTCRLLQVVGRPCGDNKCRLRCAEQSETHRKHLGEQLKQHYFDRGQIGKLQFLNALVDVERPNKKWLSKTGWSGKDFKKSAVLCRWCKLKPVEHQGTPHTFSTCPDKCHGEAFFEQRRELYLQQNPGRLTYFLPAESTARGRIPVCRQTFCNTFGLHYRSRLLARLRNKNPQLVLPTYLKRGRSQGYNQLLHDQIRQHIKRYPRSTGHYSIKAQTYTRLVRFLFYFIIIKSSIHCYEVFQRPGFDSS